MQSQMEDPKVLELIQELMETLQDKMQPGADDFDERLGVKKPDVAVMKVGIGADPMEGMPGEEKDESPDMEAKESMMGDDDMMSPEDKFKQRLMRMKG